MKKTKKGLWMFINFVLGVGAVSLVGYTTYKILNKNSTSTGIDIHNWNGVPNGYKDFSQDNSLKVDFQISPPVDLSFFSSSGTAWSWHYEKVSGFEDVYDWYLMTNFHVVNKVIAHEKKLCSYDEEYKPYFSTSDANMFMNYITTAEVTNIYDSETNANGNFFMLSRWNGKQYTNLIKKGGIISGSSVIKQYYINSIDIITDYDNNNVNLFSQSSSNNKIDFNLDMALIKVRLQIPWFFNISEIPTTDVITNYMNYYKNDSLAGEIISNQKTYISGNPSSSEQLVGVILDDATWEIKNRSLGNLEDVTLRDIKAPFYFSKNLYSNFPLSKGASGSAVYQIDNKYFDMSISDEKWAKKYLNNTIPIGIYWGGEEYVNMNSFRPSFIPFIVKNKYNIFDNFLNYINVK